MMDEGQMRIMLADDETKVRRALCLLLEQQDWASVTGEAGQAREVLAQVEATSPDLLLLDWGLPDMDGSALMHLLKKHFPYLAVVVLSGQPEAEEPALTAGAVAFVSKADPPEKLLAAILSAAAATQSPEKDT
jgi:DNA-binding NarL/FixJ family response regulator